MTERDLDRQREAYDRSFKFHDEDARSLAWYAERVADCIRRTGAGSVLSMGIGRRVVCGRLRQELGAGSFLRYTIVEGSPAAIAELDHDAEQWGDVERICASFEDFAPPRRFDLIEMGFVLEHVDDPGALLTRYREMLSAEGTLAIAVPNAESLHRRLGHLAGLLDDVHRLSAEDLTLGHRRYFDLASLRELVSGSGLRILREEGIYLKPLTTSQLVSLDLPSPVVDAMFRVAIELPHFANALYVEAIRR